ncbi:MAG: DUF2071 domain-containing protein [Acidobacteriota bacterium]
MPLHTVARDCLYVNWAVPAEAVPPLPGALRYEVRSGDGGEWVLVTALFFRFVGLRSPTFPWARLSYPQLSLRLHVLDSDDVASVLFMRMMAPAWVAPVARWFGRQPVSPARFSYPLPSSGPAILNDVRRWHVAERGSIAVRGHAGAAAPGPGPDFGNWRRAVDYVRRRSRGYVLSNGGVRRVRRQQPQIDAVPMVVEVTSAGLLEAAFPEAPEETWTRPHSAWLCPEIPVTFELGRVQFLPHQAPRRPLATAVDGC